MSNLRKFSQRWLKTGIVILISILAVFTIVKATPPASPYTPGQTLDPSCSPGDANCTVTTSGWVNSGTYVYPSSTTWSVGIGTTTPSYKLDIVGDLRVTTSSTLGNVISGVWQGTAIGDAYISSAGTWNAKQNALTFPLSAASTTDNTSFPIGLASTTGVQGTLSFPLAFSSTTHLTATTPLTISSGVLSIPTSTVSQDGFLTAADWLTFSSKITTTSLSAVSPLAYNNTTGIFSMPTSTSGQSGYLSSNDWTTFNNKQNALTFPLAVASTSLTAGTNLVLSTNTLSVTSTPSFSSITDTGLSVNGGIIYATSSGVLSQNANIVIDNSGNVGIGTTNPAYKLDIASSIAGDRGINTLVTGTSGTNYGGVFISQGSNAGGTNVGFYSAAYNGGNSYGLQIAGPSAGTNQYAIYSNATAQSYIAGNVGIGTTTPQYKLDLQGDLRVLTSSTLGNVISGVWQGTAIGDAYISSAGTWNAKQSPITLSTSTFRTATAMNISSSSGTFTLNYPEFINDLAAISTSTGNLLVASSSGWKGLSVGANGKVLMASSTASTGVSWETVSASASAGGSTTQLQYNNGGAFAGDANLTWSSSTQLLTLTGTSTISGNLTVGTTTIWSSLFNIATTTNIFTVLSSGRVGIGTSTPMAALHIGNTSSSHITSPSNALMVSGELEVAGSAYLGPMEFPSDSGVISWIDMPISTSTAASTIESYSARLGGTNILTIYGLAAGAAGGITNPAVGIGTTTPSHALTVNGGLYVGTSTIPTLFVASSTGRVGIGTSTPATLFTVATTSKTNIFSVLSAGRVGVGTSTPATLFTVATTTDIFNVLSSGNVGIGTTTPAYKLQIAGAIVPTSDNLWSLGTSSLRWSNIFAASSTVGDLIFGNEFRIVEDYETPQALIFKNHRGEEIMRLDENGNLVVPGSISSGTSTLSLSDSSNSSSTEQNSASSTVISSLIDGVKQAFVSLGLAIENGVMRIKELITDTLFAKKARIEKLEMVDSATGEIYCTWIENGEWQKIKGECETPVEEPLPADPPAEGSPEAGESPAEEPPAEDPSIEEPPAEITPPAEQPPAEEPSAEEPPVPTLEEVGATTPPGADVGVEEPVPIGQEPEPSAPTEEPITEITSP